MIVAKTATGAYVWDASLGRYIPRALTTVQSVAIRNSLMLNNTGRLVPARPTNSEGDTVATEVVCGDKVRVEFNGEVCSPRDGDRANVDVTIGGNVFHVEGVPVNKMAVTKAVAPPQPTAGSLISYYGDKYLRTPAGWCWVKSTSLGTPCAWDTFDHRAVYLLTQSGTPMTTR